MKYINPFGSVSFIRHSRESCISAMEKTGGYFWSTPIEVEIEIP